MPLIDCKLAPSLLSINVRAAMHWPSNSDRREQFTAVEWVRMLVDDDDADTKFTITGADLRRLLEAPSFPLLKEELRGLGKRAYIAAFVFLFMFLMDRMKGRLPKRGVAGASLSKAKFLAAEWAKNGATYGDGSSMYTSDKVVESCWKEFRGVAHLWAALEMNRISEYAPPRQLFYPDHIAKFISTAAYLQSFGLSFTLDNRARRKQETLLLRDETWLVDTPGKATILLPGDESVFDDAPFVALLRKYGAAKK